jgi:3-oxoadipate enol-lactonase/4-carboxymuconolactone decarboxylase
MGPLRRIPCSASLRCQDGELVVLDGVAHLAPAEAPDRVAGLIADHVGLPHATPVTTDDVHAAGMAVRRVVLGDAHVDRAVAATTDLTADFQRMITEYAWGTIWTRPGLDLRGRSMITLTATVARGHHEELAMHLRAARRNGLTNDEIKEVLMQTAIYCGVPDANSAFRIAAEVLPAFDDDGGTPSSAAPPSIQTPAVAGIEDGATILVGDHVPRRQRVTRPQRFVVRPR